MRRAPQNRAESIFFNKKISAIDGEKREESKQRINKSKKRQKNTTTKTKKHQNPILK